MRLFLAFAVCLTPAVALGYGEPDDEGRPNHEERLVHVFTNQVRAEPHAWPDWDTSLASSNARPPVVLHGALFEAARFHADDMSTNDCFTHASCDGTPLSERIDRYFSGPAGENIYSAFGDRSARTAITGWMNSEGHRTNILRASWTDLGTGFAGAQTVYFVQNFGQSPNVSIPHIVGGAFEPLGARMNLVMNSYDPGGEDAGLAEAVLGATRVALSEVSGPGGQQTFQAETDFPSGCESLVFEATSKGGQQSRFPTTGALLVGSSCDKEFDASGGPTPGGSGGPVIIDANNPDSGGCQTTPTSTWLGLLLFLGLLWCMRGARPERRPLER